MSSIVLKKLNKYKILLTTIKRRGPARLFVHTEEGTVQMRGK
jgi:hypothetical protein